MRPVTRTLKCYDYTTIAHKHVQLDVKFVDEIAKISFSRLELTSYQIPERSEIILEAFARGAVPKLELLGYAPEFDLLKTIEVLKENLENTQFHLTILSPSDKVRKIAECRYLDVEIPAQTGGSGRSLLPTQKVDDLGSRLWRLRIADDGFCVEINRNKNQIDDIVASPEFKALVNPEITKQIALEIVNPDSVVAAIVKDKWERIFDSEYHDVNNLKDESPTEWADEVADAFTKKESWTTIYLDQRAED